ncbi:MAG: YHS domain-containing protein [Acidobacteriia bacterium]|nr:YHS domain-containing protein [Terriglobia bacterium]
MIQFLLRIIFYVFLLFLLLRVIRSLFSRPSKPRPNPSGSSPDSSAVTGRMEKDPVCGMYVDVSTALREERSGKSFFFCSEECRRRFLKSSP